MSVVQLTHETREVPYFSSFSNDEKEVVVPRLFVNESMNYSNLEELTMDELTTMIENRAYLGLNNEDQVMELMWRLTVNEIWNKVTCLSTIVENELKSYIEDINFKLGIKFNDKILRYAITLKPRC